MKKHASRNCAIATLMLISGWLTGCAGGSPGDRQSWVIYQPRVLTLAAGQPVPTKAGVYTPQVDEVWHSAAAFAKVESQLVDALGVIAQLRGTANGRVPSAATAIP